MRRYFIGRRVLLNIFNDHVDNLFDLQEALTQHGSPMLIAHGKDLLDEDVP